ncbi:hypothetical protein C7S18_19565 [Ahniella affigens]|uniref:RNA polymerase subunit sigma-24 n=1 Tax=Ahniella affigens TaxID=2021234 RepID=A0A2P1PWQ7_9GAMM|nr:sigma-70 family RNA polymerase sigma factor [Ahniella affigens]AVP99224.1 hypothetical protein C7S18_19565 [Ahniella affigens]
MHFPSTRWSLLVAAADPDQSRVAWEALARSYRPAIVAYFRARFRPEVAEDLTQQFLTESIESAWWTRADAGTASFRTFLRVLLQRFGARHHERFSVEHDPNWQADDSAAESSAPAPGPEQIFELRFAQILVHRAEEHLKASLQEDPAQLALLPMLFADSGHGDLKQVAEQLSLTPNTLTQRLKRLRVRFKAQLRSEIGELLSDPENLDVELQGLLSTLRRA